MNANNPNDHLNDANPQGNPNPTTEPNPEHIPSLERYRTAMSDVKAPAHLPDQVLKAARDERVREQAEKAAAQQTGAVPGRTHTADGAAAGAARAAAGSTAALPRRFRYRGAAIAACAALALGAGLLAAGPLGIALHPAVDDAATTSAPAGLSSGFTLVAYADDLPLAQTPTAASLGFDDGSIAVSGGFIRDPAHPDDAVKQWDESIAYEFHQLFRINPAAGDAVASMTCTFDGANATFKTSQVIDAETGEATSPADTPTGFDVAFESTPSITLDTAELSSGSYDSGVTRDIEISFPLDSNPALRAACEEKWQKHAAGDDSPEAQDAFYAVGSQAAAEALAQVALNVLITFTDGSTIAKTYAIEPVDNLAEHWLEQQALLREGADAESADIPPLLTVREITA